MPHSRAAAAASWLLYLISTTFQPPVVDAADVTNAPADAKPTAADAKKSARIEKLRKAALGKDLSASDAAIAELQALGEPAEQALLGALRQVLARDKAAVLSAAATLAAPRAADKFAAVRERVESTREAALANLEELRKGEPVVKAREYHDALVKDLTEFNAALAPRDAIIRLTSRRAKLLEAYRAAAPQGDTQFNKSTEAKLAATAGKALGVPPGEVPVVPSLGEGEPPDDPLLRHVWHYRACRDIEAYNATLRAEVSKGEWDNFTRVNRYREALGLLPFELDARLVQSARRHSREMHEQQYFSHESPTPGLRSYADRMLAAGYDRGCYGENIAAGPPNAQQTFEGWFDSPGHHRIMVHAASTALGVGKWGRFWTQHMGTAPRLMLASPAERAKAEVEGTVVKPQP